MTEAKQLSRPVWATKLPWAIDRMQAQVKALELLFGPDLAIVQRGACMVVFTPGDPCHCLRCDQEVWRVTELARGLGFGLPEPQMHLCPECGSKRCGLAMDHRHMCDYDPFLKDLKRG